MTRFYSSDLHLGHSNIIKYGNRPFANADEMDEFLITTHNQYVRPEDHWSNLGDVTMSRGGQVQQDAFIRLMKRFNGHKRLYLGNHDHFPIKTYIEAGFEKIYATWRDESGLIFSHFPLHPSSLGSATANVHGHVHQNPSPVPAVYVGKDQKVWIKPYINISVEVTDYRPISHEEIMERVKAVKESKGSWEPT